MSIVTNQVYGMTLYMANFNYLDITENRLIASTK
jgi:hypothetical protein